MPEIDGLNVPVLEWCPVYDAVLWIMLRRPPRTYQHNGLIGHDGLSLGFSKDGPICHDPDYIRSSNILHEAAKQEKVVLRGRPATGPIRGVFESDPQILGPNGEILNENSRVTPKSLKILCESWGDVEIIAPSKLGQAGQFAFHDVFPWGILRDGVFYASEDWPTTAWAYCDIEVNVPQLIRCFHPAEGKALRVGTEVDFLEPEKPREQFLPDAALKSNRGGRPRMSYRDAVINATWGAIFRGSLGSDNRKAVRDYVTSWLTTNCKEKPPGEDQIREIVKGIWDQLELEDPTPPNIPPVSINSAQRRG